MSMKKNKPRLKNIDEMFGIEDLKSSDLIPVNNLLPFKNHPFNLYDGERFENMADSIKANGIIVPIIVRPHNLMPNIYEILSGHNRVEAAKFLGIENVPAVIKTDIDDDDALLIVTETNLAQRSFAEFKHSEKAVIIKTHMNAVKKQGKRNDLINEINKLLNTDKPHKTDKNETCAKIGTSLKSRDKTAEKFGLDPKNISRYIRLAELNAALLSKVDNKQIAFNPAVSISYLTPDEQTELNRLLDENKYKYKLDMKKAETLRNYSEDKKLTAEKTAQILSGELGRKQKTKPAAPLKIKHKIYSKYFAEDMKQSEIESIVDKALEYYFNRNKHSDT